MDEGQALPPLDIVMADGTKRRLTELGLPLVLFFYPKDDTAGCTGEARDFTALAPAFTEAGATVIGISKDSSEVHRKFAAKHALTVPLATDADGHVCEAFGVWGEKSLYGRRYWGIERATFLFDAGGRLVRAWRKVKVAGHAESVLAGVRAL